MNTGSCFSFFVLLFFLTGGAGDLNRFPASLDLSQGAPLVSVTSLQIWVLLILTQRAGVQSIGAVPRASDASWAWGLSPPPHHSRFWVVFLLGMEPRGMWVNKHSPSLNYYDGPPFSLRHGRSFPACEHPHYKPAGIFQRSGHWLKDNSPAFGWQWLSLWMLTLDFWNCMCLGNQEMLMSLDWQPPSRAH